MKTQLLCLVLILVPAASNAARGAEKAAAKPAAPAVKPTVVKLWPNDMPELKKMKDKDIPTLTIYLPAADKATGAGVVICPGGGYGHLAMDHEGHQVARWLNSFGVAGFILRYRHRGTGFGHPAPLSDAQRAVATVRIRAEHWRVLPDRIGILGFSAGGHLASSAGVHFHKGKPDAADPIARISCRPDFMVLVYPVIAFNQPYTHRGSMRNLLGRDPDAKLVEKMSSEKQVTADTPPTFLIATHGDRGVPAENSVAFFLALRKAKVPCELHVYEHGGHGFGLRGPGATATWPDRCREWMQGRKLLEKK